MRKASAHQPLIVSQTVNSNMSPWPQPATNRANQSNNHLFLLFLIIFMLASTFSQLASSANQESNSQITTPCNQQQQQQQPQPKQQQQQDYETTKTEAPPQRPQRDRYSRLLEEEAVQQVAFTAMPIVSSYSYAPVSSSSTSRRREQQRENDRRLRTDIVWPPRQFDDDDEQDELIEHLLLVDSSPKSNHSSQRLALLKLPDEVSSPEPPAAYREEHNVSERSVPFSLQYRPTQSFFERPVASRLSIPSMYLRPSDAGSPPRPMHLMQRPPARLVSGRQPAPTTFVALRDLRQKQQDINEAAARFEQLKTNKLVTEKSRFNSAVAKPTYLFNSGGVKVRNELLFTPDNDNNGSTLVELSGSGVGNHSSRGSAFIRRPSPFIVDLEESLQQQQQQPQSPAQQVIYLKTPPNMTDRTALYSAQQLQRIDALPTDVDYSDRLPSLVANTQPNVSLYFNSSAFEARQNDLDDNGNDNNDDANEARANLYSRRKFDLSRNMAASSTGIRVTAGQSPRPLVINNNGLIVAAKKNMPGRPYNPSASLQPTNQMEHSLSPIQPSGSEETMLDDEYGGRQDRPSFLQKPLIISNIPWASENSSSQSNRQPSSPAQHLQQTYNLTANSIPFQIYTSNHSSSNSGLLTPVDSDNIVEQDNDTPQHPIYNLAPNPFYEEVNVSQKNNSQTGVVAGTGGRHNQTTSAPLSGSFHHNPPYTKQHLAAQRPYEMLGNTTTTMSLTEDAPDENCNRTTTPVPSTTSKPQPIKQQQPQQQRPQSQHNRTSGATNSNRKPQGQSTYELSGAASSTHQDRYNQHVSSLVPPPIKNTTPANIDPNTSLDFGSNSTMTPSQLSDMFVQRYQVNSTTTLRPMRAKNKLQHLLIAKILKNQAAGASGGLPVPTTVQQLSAPATPPPLLSSTVANNVATLLAQKLGSLVRPAFSPLNSLFGIRVGSGATTSQAGRLKQRFNALGGSEIQQQGSINRRTTGVGSLLFSGFIYGLSVLPALMALTGINPLNGDSSGGSASSLAAAVANRHGNQAAKKRKRLMARQPLLPLPSDPLSSYAYLMPYTPPASAADAELDSAGGLSSSGIEPQPSPSVQSVAGLIGPPATSMSELQSILDDPDSQAHYPATSGRHLRGNHLHYSQSFAPTPSNSWLEQQFEAADEVSSPTLRHRHLRDLGRWPSEQSVAAKARRSNVSESRKLHNFDGMLDITYDLDNNNNHREWTHHVGKNSAGNQYHHRDNFEDQSPTTTTALLTQFPTPQQQRPLRVTPLATGDGEKRVADQVAAVQLALENYLLTNSLVNHHQEQQRGDRSAPTGKAASLLAASPIQQEQRQPVDSLGTRPQQQDMMSDQRAAEFSTVSLDSGVLTSVRDPYSAQSGLEETVSANQVGFLASSSRHRGRRTPATHHAAAGESALKPVIMNRPAPPILFGTVLPDVPPPPPPLPARYLPLPAKQVDFTRNLTGVKHQLPLIRLHSEGHHLRNKANRHSKLISASPNLVDVKSETTQWKAVTTSQPRMRSTQLPTDLSQAASSANKLLEPKRWSTSSQLKKKRPLGPGKGSSTTKKRRKRPPRTTTETPMFINTEPDLLMAHTMAMGSRVLNERV